MDEPETMLWLLANTDENTAEGEPYVDYVANLKRSRA